METTSIANEVRDLIATCKVSARTSVNCRRFISPVRSSKRER